MATMKPAPKAKRKPKAKPAAAASTTKAPPFGSPAWDAKYGIKAKGAKPAAKGGKSGK